MVQPDEHQHCTVIGRFYRAVNPARRCHALSGSRLAGRYSTAQQPTLYLSSSPQGVEAAMAAHGGVRGALTVMRFDVNATGVIDLRDPTALSDLRIELADAVAPWQELVAAGATPPSWRVRQRLEEAGARGLIDPSRTHPGLWHLVLFTWNVDGGARVTPAGAT